MTKQEFLHDLVDNSVTRRNFAKSAMKAGMAIGAVGVIDGTQSSASAQAITDVDILNFALNLEYLEAEFYTVITTGQTINQLGIPISGVGNQGPTTGAAGPLNFGNNTLLQQTALELAFDERAHVLVLRGALGGAAIAKPAINFQNLVRDIPTFLQISRVLEDIGVSAYGGAAPLIQSRAILATAARIALAEGIHTGNIRLHAAQNGVLGFRFDSLDIAVGVPATPTARLISVDQNGLTPVRTPSQVLSLVYTGREGAPAGTDRGLLFPNGVNGNIRTV